MGSAHGAFFKSAPAHTTGVCESEGRCGVHERDAVACISHAGVQSVWFVRVYKRVSDERADKGV